MIFRVVGVESLLKQQWQSYINYSTVIVMHISYQYAYRMAHVLFLPFPRGPDPWVSSVKPRSAARAVYPPESAMIGPR